jgi:hypothetical protein
MNQVLEIAEMEFESFLLSLYFLFVIQRKDCIVKIVRLVGVILIYDCNMLWYFIWINIIRLYSISVMNANKNVSPFTHSCLLYLWMWGQSFYSPRISE